jgi:hypothetical protein
VPRPPPAARVDGDGASAEPDGEATEGKSPGKGTYRKKRGRGKGRAAGAKSGRAKSRKAPAVQVDVKCPQCGAPMVQRTSARGPFLGCSRFPECRGTRNVEPAANTPASER